MSPAIRKKIFRFFKSVLGEKRTRKLQYLPFQLLYGSSFRPSIRVDFCSFVENKGIFISGWANDHADSVISFEIEIPGNQLVNMSAYVERVPRLKIQKKLGLAKSDVLGFTAFLPMPDVKNCFGRGKLNLLSTSGKQYSKTVNIEQAANNPLATIKNILKDVPIDSPRKKILFDKAYGPAIDSIWSQRKKLDIKVTHISYNQSLKSDNPETSIIVPIYGRYDFIEFQLSLFVNDPDMGNHEIIYVIDDPRIIEEVKTVCQTYEKLYHIAFSVVYLAENTGFAAANNFGAQYAEAPNILMMNSDVMPSKPGWLNTLLYDVNYQLEDSIVGARLLYEDDTIQHDGMRYYASPFVNNLWTNTHPGKGFPSTAIRPSSTPAEVEAVTGACILVTRKNYQMLGGLDENYILGDYEDSDFCMRARAAGLKVLVNQRVSLYHLERQSQSLVTADRWKNELTYYNCWHHSRKWHNEIQALKKGKVYSPHLVAVR